MAGVFIKNGETASIKGRTYTCQGRGPKGRYLFTPHIGRTNRYFSPEQLFDLAHVGEFAIVTNETYEGEKPQNYEFDISGLLEKDLNNIAMRYFYMKAMEDYIRDDGLLSDISVDDYSKTVIFPAYIKYCEKNDRVPPQKHISGSALRRWFRRWLNSGGKLNSLVHDARGNTHQKLTHEQLSLLDDVIKKHYLNKKRRTAKKVYKTFSSQIVLLNHERVQSGLPKIKKPHYNTLLAHISKIGLFDRLAARYSPEYAQGVTRQQRKSPLVSRILECVQADNTQLDTYLDMGSRILIRPWLTSIIDRYSNSVLGYWITIGNPTSDSVMNALRMAVMPKEAFTFEDGKSWMWPMHGIPSELVVDNGKDFLSKDVEVAAAELNITLNRTPPYKPYFKAQVERKFREINEDLLSQIAGQVFKYEPEKHGLDYPHLTLDEFKTIFLKWLVTVYHKTPNDEGYTPDDLWLQSVQKHGIPGSGLSNDYVKQCLAKSSDREHSIHPQGIKLNSLVFNNEWLSRLRNELVPYTPKGQPKVIVKWSAHDVSLIWVKDPRSNEFFPVHSTEKLAHGRSLYNHKVVLRECRNRKAAHENNVDYASAVLSLDNIIETATNDARKRNKLPTRAKRFMAGRPNNKTGGNTTETVPNSSVSSQPKPDSSDISPINHTNGYETSAPEYDDDENDYEEFPDDVDLT